MYKWIFSKTGEFHLSTNEENQDELMFDENDSVAAAVVADGASGCRFGKTGAKTVCEAVLQFLMEEDVFWHNYSKEKFAYLLTEHILYRLEQAAEIDNAPMNEYACTLTAVCIDKKNYQAIALGLGDSAVLSVEHKNIHALIPAERIRNQPCLITDDAAASNMIIKYFDTDRMNTILLCTDGFLNEYSKKENDEFRQALRSENFNRLNELLVNSSGADDQSYIAISCRQ